MEGRKFLGVEVAAPEQQRRAALFVLAAFLIVGLGAVAAFVGPSAWRHYTFVTTEGHVTERDVLCHY